MRTCLGIFLIIIFIPIALASALALNLKITVLKPQFLKEELVKVNAYDSVVKGLPALIDQTAKDDQSKQMGELLKSVTSNITPEILQSKTEKFIDDYYSYLKTGKNLPSIDISELKKGLSQSKIQIPQGELDKLIPDQYQLPQSQGNQNALKNYRLFQNLSLGGVVVSILILVLILVAAPGGFAARAKWLSAPLLVTSLIVLGGAFLGLTFFSSTPILEGILGGMKNLSALSFLPKLSFEISRAILSLKMWESLAALGISILILILAVILGKRRAERVK